MSRKIRSLSFIVFGLLALSACRPPDKASEPADLVLKNGVIYTVDAQSGTAEAIAVKDAKFVYVGTTSGAEAFIGKQTAVTDLQGSFALPGFIDSHAHVIGSYRVYFEVNLYGLKTADEIQRAIRDFTAARPGMTFVKGRGWSNTDFPKTGPHRGILDAVVKDVPASFSSEDGHSVWVNSKALELAGISKKTANPAGGIIERDPATGEPTGTLRENAAGLVSGIFPPPTLSDLMKGIEAYQKMALAFGITTVHDSQLDAWSDEIAAFQTLEGENRLNLRVRASLAVDPARGTGQIEALVRERERHTGDLFQTRAAKIFIDGVVEGSTAYLKEPYVHAPDSRGEFLWTVGELNRVCTELERNGFQIHVHAIGDAAAAVALDAFAQARAICGVRDGRNMITHLQLVAPEDILRFKDLGVTAVPQPYWFAKDSYYHNLQVPYLGPKRADEEYPMKSFFDAGVLVASGSDFPVTIPCDPLIAIEMGITRHEPGKTGSENVLWPEERVTLEQMIRSFTINGARANFLEDTTGSVEIGKSADLIVLDRNLFKIPAEEISRARVTLTLFRGKIVSRAEPGK